MKGSGGIGLALVLLLSGGGCRRGDSAARAPGSSRVATATDAGFVRGIALGLFARPPEYDYGPLLDEIAAHGATDVLLAFEWFQTSPGSADLGPSPQRTPDADTLVRTIRAAQVRGLRVGLMPQVGLLQPAARDQWRGRIRARSEPLRDRWFARYQALLVEVAALAQTSGVVRLGVGSELLSLEGEAARWQTLIAAVRQRYTGRLFYSANWDHYAAVSFFDALDEVGVTGYFELGHAGTPEKAALAHAWAGPRAALAALAQATGKPVLLTEVGYASRSDAWRSPWNAAQPVAMAGEDVDVAPRMDQPLQALLYQVFCDAFAGRGVIRGFYVWNWFGFGGPTDVGYTPRGKPAARVLEQCFVRRDWDVPPPGRARE